MIHKVFDKLSARAAIINIINTLYIEMLPASRLILIAGLQKKPIFSRII